MKALITGATGFLGRELCKQLKLKGYDIFPIGSKDCDLTNSNEIIQFSNEKFDQIFHLAAWTRAGDFCLRHSGEQWIINQLINTNVLSWWKYQQPQAKMIAIGTSCSYDPSFSLKEKNFLKGRPIDSLFTYAYTKRMLYSGLLALNKQYKMKYLFVIPSTLYGPSYHTDNRQMHFIFDVIRKILDLKNKKSKEVILWGDGNQKREIIHVEDFVKLLLLLNKKSENEIFNIGLGEEYSIKFFSEIICKMTKINPSFINFDKNKYTGAKSKVLNVSKIKSFLKNNFKQRSIYNGLQETIEWMKNFY
jgi:GDP-L-fucose synthase